MPPPWQGGAGLVLLLGLLVAGVFAAAWSVVNRLTRRQQSLRQGVEQFGAGELSHRVAVSGSDEVAAVAASFNQAASRIEALVRSHQSLLANASHELRSPLARMRMAVSMLEEADPAQRERLKREIDRHVTVDGAPSSPRKPHAQLRRSMAAPPACSATSACCAASCAT